MDNDVFKGWTREQLDRFFEEAEFAHYRQLPTGEWVGVTKLLFTWSVCADVTPEQPFTYRWCFEKHTDAMHFYENMEEYDEIPERIDSLKGHRFTRKPLLEKDLRDVWHKPT